MVILNTLITPEPLAIPLTHADTVLSFGSCFAEHIAAKLKEYRFNIQANPTGILYNPASIHQVFSRLQQAEPFTEKDLFLHQDLWRSFMHHGSFAHPDKNVALERMNAEFERAQAHLKNCSCLFLTLGSAFAWFLQSKPTHVVANCHKLPSSTFERRMIPAHDIARLLGDVFLELTRRNPTLQIILTVSPIRHLRHSAPENSLSKAQLITACHLLSAEWDSVHYFPAYEIMLDELRDYRFYANDLTHPNELAQQIIWERFVQSCIDEKSRQFIADYTPILNMQHHRPLHPETPSATKFKQALETKTACIQAAYPHIALYDA
jgi:hypothetical protein